MLRTALAIAVCCLAFVLGCEKKEAEQGPAGRPTAGVQAPAGMVVLGQKPATFLTESPVSIGQYVQYLKDSGQPVPEEMRAIGLGGPGGGLPVTDLSRKQAERYATWNLMRLPTQQEWATASPYVAPAPYPWVAADENTPVAGSVYLVQDWLPGTPGEQKAIAAKQDLLAALEQERAAGFDKARQELADLMKARKADAQARWDQFKPAFFGRVEKQKQLAELNAQKAARQDVLRILGSVAQAKGKVASVVTLGEGDTQAAVKGYQDQLAQWRSQVQQTRQTLEDKTKELQQEVVKQTDAFDQLGSESIAGRFAEAEALLQQSAQAPTQAREAAELQSKLVAAREQLQDSPPLFEALPDPASQNKEAADLQQQIDTFPADKDTVDQIAKVKESIQGFGQGIAQDFLDEKLLLQDLDTLADLRSRREAVQANLAALQAVMRQLATPETTAP